MKISRRGLLLAPLPMPIIFSLMFEISAPGQNPILSVLFFSAFGSVVSYGITICLFVPLLYLVSKFTSLTAIVTSLVGMVVGFIVYFPVAWQMYISSGVDSGPPQGTFKEYLLRQGFQWDFWALLFAGMVTAFLYWYISKRSTGTKDTSSSENVPSM
jgi:hypothetical protein